MNYKKGFLKFILAAGDLILMYAAILLALAIRENDFSFLPGFYTRLHLFYFSFLFGVWLLLLFILDFYEVPPLKNIFDFFSRLFIFFLIAFAAGIIFFYFQSTITPKTVLFLDVLFLCILLIGWRWFFNLFLKIIKFKERIVIIGTRPELREVHSEILLNKYAAIVYFNVETLRAPLFKDQIKKSQPDYIILAPSPAEKKNLIKNNFSNFPLGFNYVNFKDFYEKILKKVPIDSINEAWFLENFRHRSKLHDLFKRVFDVFFSGIGMVSIGLIFPVIVLVIKLSSSGTIFYKQKRVGQSGKIFTLYKFRTMYQNAEEHGAQWAQKNDPRITFVGRFLRTLYIDEFPQFYNVWRGDMSFIGPRPERPEFVEHLKKEIPFYDLRHLIKPGLTGWAQISYKYGSSVEDAKEKLKYDLYYIKHRLISFDFCILLKTISAIIKTDFVELAEKLKKIKPSSETALGRVPLNDINKIYK